MDSAFPTADYPGYTTNELREFLRKKPDNAKMSAEIERRERVAQGDVSVMTPGERLRYARKAKDGQLLALRAAAPMRPCNRQTEDVDGLGLFDAVRSPVML